MRRIKKTKTFKGSIFVTFVDRETAEKFTKDETSTTFNGKPLVVMMQNDYWQVKLKETKERKQAEKEAKLAKKAEVVKKGSKAKGDKRQKHQGKKDTNIKTAKRIKFNEDGEVEAKNEPEVKSSAEPKVEPKSESKVEPETVSEVEQNGKRKYSGEDDQQAKAAKMTKLNEAGDVAEEKTEPKVESKVETAE